jgi:hypothetical protein
MHKQRNVPFAHLRKIRNLYKKIVNDIYKYFQRNMEIIEYNLS